METAGKSEGQPTLMILCFMMTEKLVGAET